jgi:hypothetical protein
MLSHALALAIGLVLLAGCGGSAPPATGPAGGPGAVAVPSASSGASDPTPPPARQAPVDARACCTPPGAYDPSDTSYEDCVARGGRRWGTDGCGVKADGTVRAPPPSVAPRAP